MDISKKEADFAIFVLTLKSHGLSYQPRNRYEQWKQDKWPPFLKRFQPVKYGWIKSTLNGHI